MSLVPPAIWKYLHERNANLHKVAIMQWEKYPTLHQPLPPQSSPNPPKTGVPQVPFLRILGVIFDKSGTFQDHVYQLIARLKRRLLIIKRLSFLSWGPNTLLLINTYKALFQNVIAYGICAWGGFVPEHISSYTPHPKDNPT